jgi:hypothetical protein
VTDPADTIAIEPGEPIMVGPITLLICPMAGPVNARRAPHVWAEALPLLPPIAGLFVPTQPALPIWSPAIGAPTGSGNEKLDGQI